MHGSIQFHRGGGGGGRVGVPQRFCVSFFCDFSSGGGGGISGAILVRVCEQNILKPTPIIYLAFEKSRTFIYSISPQYMTISTLIACSQSTGVQ